MRTRKKITKVSDLIRDPDMRIVFQKEHHQDFLTLLSIGEEYAINPTTLSRHLVLIFIRKMKAALDKAAKDVMMTEVMQSIHGIMQVDMFQKPAQVDSPIRAAAAPKPAPKTKTAAKKPAQKTKTAAKKPAPKKGGVKK